MARAVEERLIVMYKSGHGYFWIGGPGEEAFNVALGLLIYKGNGPAYDFLHLHYRQLATLLAMGEDPKNPFRQMKNTASDPYSGGRNFVGHISKREWNILPVTSPIEVQYACAIGTAIVQKRLNGRGITIVTGGDAGTAEGDFSSCLNWCTRPGEELPVLIIVTHNGWGISTPSSQVQGVPSLSLRALGYGIKAATVDGNDPVASHLAITTALDYVRTTKKPYFLEANVSRLYGHSSASGTSLDEQAPDCIALFERKLIAWGYLTTEDAAATRAEYAKQCADWAREVRDEEMPSGDSIWNHVFWGEPGRSPL